MRLSNVRRRLVGVSRHPEFRVAVLACLVWLFLVQAYQPWRYSRTYKSPRILEEATFFFWRIGFNVLHNGPSAIAIGLASIVLLVCALAWVVRSFGRRDDTAPAPFPLGASPVSSAQPEKADLNKPDVLAASDTGDGVDEFLKQCHSILLNCWQQIQSDDRHQEANVITLRAAYRDYILRVSPWLSTILDAYRNDTKVVMKARNSAAKCLSSLAGGFLCVRHDDDAQILASEARTLVLDDPALEREIDHILEEIGAERRQASADNIGCRKAVNDHARTKLGFSQGNVARILTVFVATIALSVPFVVKTFRSSEVHSNASVPEPYKEKRSDEEPPSLSSPETPTVYPESPPVLKAVPIYHKKTAVLEAVPTDRKRATAFLPSGTWVQKPRATEGRGALTIQNGGDLDSEVKLVGVRFPRQVFWAIYIRAHEEKTVNEIGAGAYLLRFALGRDWDADARKFLQNPRFYQMGKQLVFAETEPIEDRPGKYTKFNVTLHEVPGGNLPRIGITEAEFGEGTSE